MQSFNVFAIQPFNVFALQPLNIGQEFAKVYYNRMMVSGVNGTIDLFNPNVICTIDSEELVGSYNWLLKMTKAGIARFEYQNISGSYQPLISNQMCGNDYLIVVNGNLRAVNLWGYLISDWMRFNETFILGKYGDNYVIRNYILSTK